MLGKGGGYCPFGSTYVEQMSKVKVKYGLDCFLAVLAYSKGWFAHDRDRRKRERIVELLKMCYL